MIFIRYFNTSSDYYNAIAHIYDNMYKDIYWTIARQQIKETIEKHISSVKELSVIDIGGGTGYWTKWALGIGARVVLVEPAKKMLEQAIECIRKEFDQKLEDDCIEFLNCFAEDIDEQYPLEEDFDVVFLFGDVLSYVKDVDKTMKNVKRATKKGALVFGTVDNYYSYLRDVIVYGTWKDYEYLRKNGKLPIGSEYGTFEAKAFRPSELKGIFESYGFEIIELSALASMPSLETSIRYGKYLVFEAEHLFFVAKKL